MKKRRRKHSSSKLRPGQRQAVPIQRHRGCGGCTACCTATGVEEMDKAAGDRCQHVTNSGCSIYENRPASCQGFTCLWKGAPEGSVSQMDRPDRLGFVMWPQKTLLGDTIVVNEYVTGSTATPHGREYLERFASTFPVLISTNPRKVLGPPRIQKLLSRIDGFTEIMGTKRVTRPISRIDIRPTQSSNEDTRSVP
jgi:hypothetical protein